MAFVIDKRTDQGRCVLPWYPPPGTKTQSQNNFSWHSSISVSQDISVPLVASRRAVSVSKQDRNGVITISLI